MDGAGGSKHSCIWAGRGGVGEWHAVAVGAQITCSGCLFCPRTFQASGYGEWFFKIQIAQVFKKWGFKTALFVTFMVFLYCLSLFASQFGMSGLWVCLAAFTLHGSSDTIPISSSQVAQC